MNKQIEWGLTILIIVGILALCIFATNQFLLYYKKAELLQTPCQLCCQYNKNFECPKESNLNWAFNVSDIKVPSVR